MVFVVAEPQNYAVIPTGTSLRVEWSVSPMAWLRPISLLLIVGDTLHSLELVIAE